MPLPALSGRRAGNSQLAFGNGYSRLKKNQQPKFWKGREMHMTDVFHSQLQEYPDFHCCYHSNT